MTDQKALQWGPPGCNMITRVGTDGSGVTLIKDGLNIAPIRLLF